MAKKKHTPTVRLTVPEQGGVVGQPITIKLAIGDKDSNLQDGSFLWGDGVGDTWKAIPPTSLTHTYDTAKTFTVRCVVHDATGGQGTATAEVIVALAEPIPPEPPTGARLYLTPAVEAAVTQKRKAWDPDWLRLQDAADRYRQKLPPWVRVVSAANTNPVVFTADSALPWAPGTSVVCYLVGATGPWAGVNNNPPKGAWTATARPDGRSFSIPVDATQFGAFHDVLTVWVYGNLTSQYLDYGQSGDQWWDAAFTLSLAFRQLEDPTYSAAALRFFEWWSALGAAGLDAPVSQDSGRGSFGVQPAVTTVYDWLYAQLSSTQKADAVKALNRWNTWTDKFGESRHSATSNYWEAHQLAFLQTGYATQEENPQAAQWIETALLDWETDLVPMFDPPVPGQQIYGSNEGFYYSGTANDGFNYGGNNIARHVQRLFLIKSATDEDVPGGRAFAARWARNLLYQLRPDRWQAPTHGQWTGDWTGVMKFNDAIFLSAYLAGQTEGAWMQWYLQHSGLYTDALAMPEGARAFIEGSTEYKWRLLFSDPARITLDYTTVLDPFFFADGGEPSAHWRTGWGLDDIQVIFRCGPGLYNGSLSKQAGHVDICRGTDYLVVQSNYWKGTTDGLSGVPASGDLSNAMANTLDFDDGTEVCYPRKYPYTGCQMLGGQYRAPTLRLTHGCLYGENEFASAYDSQGIPKDRTLKYWFRTVVSFGVETIVWDRIRSTKASHHKVIPWHLPGITPTEAQGRVRSTIGGSTVHVQPFTERGAAMKVSRNYVNDVPMNWRVEVSDVDPAEELRCLTAFTALPNGLAPSAVARLTSDERVIAVQVGPIVVVLPREAVEQPDGTFASARVAAVQFTSTHAGVGRYVVGGLVPGLYSIFQAGGSWEHMLEVQADGVATFSAGAGAFTVTSGEEPIPPEPTDDVVWTEDLSLAYAQTYELKGTPTARKVLRAQGHHIAVDGGGSWSGILTLEHVDIYDLGSDTMYAISDGSGWSYAYLNSAQVRLVDCRFVRCGVFNFYSVGEASILFDQNEYGDTNYCRAGGPADQAQAFFTEQGNSTAKKWFTGNRVARGTAILGSPNWTAGGAPETSNYLAGRRVGLSVLQAPGEVSFNYSRVTTDVTPQESAWSQVGNFGPFGSGVKVHNNIVRGGHWPVSGLDGELFDNVISEAQGHDFIRLARGGSAHHNILLKPYPAFASYGERYGLPSAVGLYRAGDALACVNLTIDARGMDGPSTLLACIDGARLRSFRNVVAYQLRTTAIDCPQGAGCTSAVGPGTNEGYVTPPPVRADYLDYNCVTFQSRARPVVYDLAVPDKTLGDPGYGGHDLGTLNGPGPDPRFRGPLPLGTGQLGVPSPDDGGFPFNEADILDGTYSVQDLLTYFRWIYAPADDSPLVGAQDPQDGPGDIGAVQTCLLPVDAPSIVTTNKRPQVYAGPSFRVRMGEPCYLTGWAADDGLPMNVLMVTWEMVRGPGTVTFEEKLRANTTAVFSAPGDYVLQLTADDGALRSTSACAITVEG